MPHCPPAPWVGCYLQVLAASSGSSLGYGTASHSKKESEDGSTAGGNGAQEPSLAT